MLCPNRDCRPEQLQQVNERLFQLLSEQPAAEDEFDGELEDEMTMLQQTAIDTVGANCTRCDYAQHAPRVGGCWGTYQVDLRARHCVYLETPTNAI